MELTEVAFWENYWRNCQLPNVVDMKFSFDRCLALELRKQLADCRGEALEIGCAPGKWLAFLAGELGMRPSGIEYSKAGIDATRRNFELQGIEPGFMAAADFFTLTPEPRFDLVMSLGFIEHFDDPDGVIERHLRWLRPGGTLVLGVPNFNGIYKPIQSWLDKSIIDKHNLSIMNLDFFQGLAARYSLRPQFIGYLGSFEPALLIPAPERRSISRFFINAGISSLLKLRKLRFFDRFNGPCVSSYILAIYQKQD